ncbi:hypothetical protein DRO35_02845 [Candidatus Bathyarchaeota archaeon]|nr:MAG: hypothetical protein DRO35_02845 [Candidatus Bathyarchaeota archaeon]
MSKIDVLIVPKLRKSSLKAAKILRSSNYRVIFLDFPSNLQSLISEYIASHLKLQDLLCKIESLRLIPEPVSSWLYLNNPLLEALKRLRKPAKVYCYGDVDYCHILAETSAKIARLTLRASITGRIDVKEWIRTLEERCRSEILEAEADFIGYKAEDESICITGISGWKIAKYIRRYGYQVRVRCVERLYHFKPLETLMFLMDTGSLTRKTATNLIREHVEFIREYLLTSKDLDEAYYSWIHKKHRDIKPLNASIGFSQGSTYF